MQSKTPLIYIPGLFGSLGTEILPGMGLGSSAHLIIQANAL